MLSPSQRFMRYWLPLMGWMLLIFLLSHQDKDETSLRTGLLRWLLSLAGIDGAWLMSGIRGFVLRKFAHFTEYAVLCMLVLRLAALHFSIRKALIYSLLFCLIYACSDEFHQTFVPGRVGTPMDVAIDTSGAVAGMLLWLYGWKKREKGRLKREKAA